MALLAVCFGATAYAQTPAAGEENTVKIKMVVKCQKTTTAPYARYAQQMIGVPAPLNDKIGYTVESVSFAVVNSGSNVATKHEIAKPAAGGGMLFTDVALTPPYASGREKSLKEMAQEAANTIFTLRNRRFNLVTGESGENVFGAGLEAAIREMKRIEDNYLQLFLGKEEVVYSTYYFDVVPQAGKSSYSVCRFSEDKGVIDGISLDGQPVVLSFVLPQNDVAVAEPKAKKGQQLEVTYVPALVSAKLFCGDKLLSETTLEINQLGRPVYRTLGN